MSKTPDIEVRGPFTQCNVAGCKGSTGQELRVNFGNYVQCLGLCDVHLRELQLQIEGYWILKADQRRRGGRA